jgi:hypothetical protein
MALEHDMARKSMTELLAQVSSTLADNTTGAITPAVLRSMFNDLIAAITPAYAALTQLPANTQVVGLVDSPMAFDSTYGQPALQINPTVGTTANIAMVERGVTVVQFSADFATTTGRTVTFTLFKNGAPTQWKVSADGRGVNTPIPVSMLGADYADPAATYSIGLTCSTAGTNVTISNAVLLASVQPVSSYV